MATVVKGRSARSRRDVTVSDVASHAKVSLGTVSRVLNGKTDVAPELRRRVYMSSRKLGFIHRAKTRQIAVIAGRISPCCPVGYVTTLISLITRYLSAYKYSINLIDVENLELAYQTQVQGVIGIVFDKRIGDLQGVPNLPVITLNCPMKDRGFHSVCWDHQEQARLATQHLIDNGHRRIGYLDNAPEVWGMENRLIGYRQSLERAGLAFEPDLVQYTVGHSCYEIVRQMLARGITGLLNYSEDACLEVIHFLTDVFKLSIPRDLSIVTMENLPVFQYFSPRHTVVVQPFDDLARIAVEQMIRLCEAQDGDNGELVDILLPNKLIVRDSVHKL